MIDTKQSGFSNIATVVLAAAFTLFVYISKWNDLRSNNKFKASESLGLLCRLLNTSLICSHQPAWIKTWTRFFSAPSSTDPGTHGSIESMKANMRASWQASTASHEKLSQRQNRYDFSFNSPFKIKHAKRINILVVLQYKLNKELSKISSIFWWYSYFIVFN